MEGPRGAAPRAVVLVFVTTLLGTRLASAQTMGELKGTVADAAGSPVPGALVEVTSPALIRPRQTSTDEAGGFRLPLLPPGLYAALARMTGFRDARVSDVKVSLGETASVSLTLSLSSAAIVEVSGARGLVDTESARTGIVVTEKELEVLPLGRNFASATTLVPGVGQDVLGPTFYGASSLESSFVADGLNVTGVKKGGQGKSLPLEFVQEVEIRSGGYEAEFGRALGGNVNVLTKTGGNELHGSVFAYYDSASLGAPDQHVADRAAAAVDGLEVPKRLDFGLDLGGPIVRDRVWFFGAYDRARTEQPYQAVARLDYTPGGIVPVYEARSETTGANLFALNLSWAPAPAHTVAVSVFGDPGTFHGRYLADPSVGVAAGPESALVIDRVTGGTDVSARWSGFLGRALGAVRYGFHEERSHPSSPYSSQPGIVEQRLGATQIVTGSGPLFLYDETYRRSTFGASGSLLLGDHELKGGVEYELLNPSSAVAFGGAEWINRRLAADGGFLYADHRYLPRVPLDCVLKTDGQEGHFGPIEQTECLAFEVAASHRSDFRGKTLSAYLQDSWRPLPNLTVKAGLRYDDEVLVDTNGVTKLRSSGQWSPRVSVAWDPGGEGRAKLFASFGRYYQVIPQDVQANFMGDRYDAFAYNESAGPDPVVDPAVYPYVYVQGGGAYFPEGVRPGYQDEVTAGAELQVGSRLSVGVRGVYRALGRVLEDRCDLYDQRAGIQGLVAEDPALLHVGCLLVNPGEGGIGQLNDPANPDCFEDFPANRRPRPCETVHARRTYRGLEAVVQGRPLRDLYVMASYVYSRLTGNYEGFVSSAPGDGRFQADPNNSADFDYLDLLPNGSGRLMNDRTHQVKVSSSYVHPGGLAAGLVFQLASGQPLSLYGQARPGYAGFLVPRGAYGELPSLYQLDVHLQYAVRLGAVAIVPVLDVFNVTDVQRATVRNQRYDTLATWRETRPPYTSPTNPYFGKDVAWQRPRLVRVGMRVVF